MAAAIARSTKFLTYRSSALIFVRTESLWTPNNVVMSPFRDIEIPNATIPQHVWTNMDKWADKTAIVCSVTNHQYTYNQLYKYSRNFAANLRSKFKISEGDVVCIMMPNSPDYALAILGALQAGAEVTTVNPIYTAHEVQSQLKHSNAKLVIGSSETLSAIKGAFRLAEKELPIISVKNNYGEFPAGTISLQELAQDVNVDYSILNRIDKKSEDVAVLPYSSGTTGLPKGVELMHRNIVVNCMQQDVDGVKQYDDTTSSHQESVLAILPFYHIYGLSILMFHKLSIGGKLVTLPKFHPSTFLPAINEYKISLLYAAPPIILYLASHPDVKREHLKSLKNIMSGAAPLPDQDIHMLYERTEPNTSIFQLYGLTETSPLATANVPGSKNYTSSGWAISNTELKIIDSNDNTLGPGQIGELLIRGPQVMKGYRNNPEATKESITEDGWFKSGDLVSIDKEGTITVADRLKELIKVKGFQVPPAELESVIKKHPGVLDAGVIGVPDQRTGEAPKAFVVLKPGYNVGDKDIFEFVKDRVAEYKRIKEVVFVDSLPKNPSGKLLRRVLREQSS